MAMMEFELLLGEYCSDLSDMGKAHILYHTVSLSEGEQRSLREIHDRAARTHTAAAEHHESLAQRYADVGNDEHADLVRRVLAAGRYE